MIEAKLKEVIPIIYFTEREKEIIAEILKGKLNKEIAHEHGISINTVKKYVKRIYKKAAVNNRIECALFFLRKERA
jgi:DNA-binding NarL/FixJ family response regulator